MTKKEKKAIKTMQKDWLKSFNAWVAGGQKDEALAVKMDVLWVTLQAAYKISQTKTA